MFYLQNFFLIIINEKSHFMNTKLKFLMEKVSQNF